MYPIPSNETLVETRACRQCGTEFPITDKDLEFYDKVSPTFAGVKYQIPAPTLCPDCRQQRRLSFRNERYIYKRKCSVSGKEITSQFSPDKGIPVLSLEEFYSDTWSPPAVNIDWNVSLMTQFRKLCEITPRVTLLTDLVSYQNNSEYQNGSSRNKNCYLVFCSGDNQDCCYGYSVDYCADCMENSWIRDCRACYECIDSQNCQDCYHVRNSSFCTHCAYCYDCEGCSNCVGCVGLRNQEYCIANVKYTQEEFQKRVGNIGNISDLEFLENYRLLLEKVPRRFAIIDRSENCTGDYIHDSSNVKKSIKVYECQQCAYSSKIVKCQDCYDLDSWWDTGNLIYDCITVGKDAFRCLFSNNCWPSCSDLLYCDSCISCQNCFFCAGLSNKQFCILNKQYSKSEYETLVSRIIEQLISNGEWGEFFPSSFSPFGYNETVAQEVFPISKEQAYRISCNWSDYEAPFPAVSKIIPAAKLPSDIAAVPDDILNWAIECEVTGRPFRIVKQELEFYRKRGLPIMRRHPDQRHLDRMTLRNSQKLFERKCDKCKKEMLTAYAPERPEIVYCEECYRKEVV